MSLVETPTNAAASATWVAQSAYEKELGLLMVFVVVAFFTLGGALAGCEVVEEVVGSDLVTLLVEVVVVATDPAVVLVSFACSSSSVSSEDADEEAVDMSSSSLSPPSSSEASSSFLPSLCSSPVSEEEEEAVEEEWVDAWSLSASTVIFCCVSEMVGATTLLTAGAWSEEEDAPDWLVAMGTEGTAVDDLLVLATDACLGGAGVAPGAGCCCCCCC